jgi:hypothetical protein
MCATSDVAVERSELMCGCGSNFDRGGTSSSFRMRCNRLSNPPATLVLIRNVTVNMSILN